MDNKQAAPPAVDQATTGIAHINGTGTAVATQPAPPSINLPVLTDKEAVLDVIQENLEGLGDQRFDKIVVPSGGGLSFTLKDENGAEYPVAKIVGIVLHKHPFRSWYIKSFDEKTEDDSKAPDCFSEDNVRGSGCEIAGIPAGQPCAQCPNGQWNSNRKGGKGKDCADKIRIHIAMEGTVFPKFIDVPPSSRTNFTDYCKELADRLHPLTGTITTISVEVDKTANNLKYSKLKFLRGGSVTPAERAAIKDMIGTLLPSMERISAESIGVDDVDAIPGEGKQRF